MWSWTEMLTASYRPSARTMNSASYEYRNMSARSQKWYQVLGKGRRFLCLPSSTCHECLRHSSHVCILADKRKDTKYFTILFYKMQEHILFGTCICYACCLLVELPNLNQVQWSETLVGRFDGIASLARYLTFRVIWSIILQTQFFPSHRLF